jgi:hypothetical protein
VCDSLPLKTSIVCDRLPLVQLPFMVILGDNHL